MELLNLRPARVAALLAAPAVQALISRADALRAEVHALHPLSAEAEDRVLRKFRLDWNYHSNAIEGNSLTYGETRALLLEGVVAQGKSMKDHEDIEGHRRALDLLFEMVRNNDALRQHDVRSLHQLLLGQPFQTNAQTPDGLPTRKWVYPGQYKDQPNHVVTKTGEKHYYASVEETPALMTELTDWLAANRATLPPLILSALFHHAFVSIHPFDDGNGRMTRLLANLVLMQAGFPPVIVRQQERDAYYAALSQADAGEPLRFAEFIGEGLERSLNIQLQGAQGDFSFEQDDLDKEIALLKKELGEITINLHTQRSYDSVEQTCRLDIIPLITYIVDKARKLDSLFMSSYARLYPQWSNPQYIGGELAVNATDEGWNSLRSSAETLAAEVFFTTWDPDERRRRNKPEWTTPLVFNYRWTNFRQVFDSFSIERFLRVEFEENYYRAASLDRELIITRPYHQRLSHSDFDELAMAFVASAIEEIKAKTNRA